MACAQQLARVGHDVHLFERHSKAGGLLRYGIPDFKMEKGIVDIRVKQMEAEGVTFHYGAHIGGNVPAEKLLKDHDAIALTGGAEAPRDLLIEGRNLDGIHFAMDFLPQQNRRNSGEPLGGVRDILATGKHVVVIGGGDTGSDCIGTSIRQGAKSVTNFEIMPQPPEHENKALTWPNWPLKLRISSSHEEGVDRQFAGADAEILRRRRQGEEAALREGRCAIQAGARQRVRGRRRPRAAGDGLRASGAGGHAEIARHRVRSARQRESLDRRLQDLGAESVRRRRHAARAVARGVGDPRRPPMRQCDRHLPDGIVDAAALTVRIYLNNPKKPRGGP
jgi:NADPH-dependent glutamate synthase beta subunit-like oxidoreductase